MPPWPRPAWIRSRACAAICLGLPEVTERPSHGAPSWFVRDKKIFVTLWADGHHDHHFPHLWTAAPPGVQEELVEAEPDRFFRPPYVGGRGWIGVRLDRELDWDEIAGLRGRLPDRGAPEPGQDARRSDDPRPGQPARR